MKKFIIPGAYLLALPLIASAQFGNLEALATGFKDFLDVLTGVIVALALIFFFWGLALFILSAGDEEKRAQGKKIMIWGIIAFVVIVAIWGIVTFILEAIGIEAGGDIDLPSVPNTGG